MTGALSFISRWLSRLAMTIAALCLILMTAAIGWQVFARYVLQAAPAWAEQAALVMMMWLILLGAAAGVRERFHISVSAATDAMPPRWAAACRYSALFILLLFGVAMGVYGADLVARTWAHEISGLAISRGIAYTPIPVSGWMIALFSSEWLIAARRGQEAAPAWN